MTVQQLIDRLTEMDMPNAELRLTYQKSYPLQDTVAGIWVDDAPEEPDADLTVYIVSGGQDSDMPYAPRRAFEEAW